MSAYQKINGIYACGNEPVFDADIKKAIGFKSFIMSDCSSHTGTSWKFGEQVRDYRADGCAWVFHHLVR
jgi:beta-glucosidase-like glycosyl hydrolase